MSEPIYIFAVYAYPKDFPEAYVVRRWKIEDPVPRPDDHCIHASSLEDARHKIPLGLTRLDRHPSDDPVIVETWI